jgi:hypothetical protein
MRPELKRVFESSVVLMVDACKRSAKMLASSSLSATAVLAIAWGLAQEAAARIREELQATQEGRELLEECERKAASRRPS